MQGVWAAALSEERTTEKVLPESPSLTPSIHTCTELCVPFLDTPNGNPVACSHLVENMTIGKKLYT